MRLFEATSKAAIERNAHVLETLSLKPELDADGVAVSLVNPGFVETPLTAQNDFRMPFLMSAEAFAAQAFTTIERGRSYRVIPWQMGLVAGLLRLLPNALFDRLFAGRPRKRRADGT